MSLKRYEISQLFDVRWFSSAEEGAVLNPSTAKDDRLKKESRFNAFSYFFIGILFLVLPVDKAVAEDSSVDVAGENLPYNALVYHLDLSVLAYQLYGQSLAWPFDPYFEESNNLKWDRARFIKKIRGWAGAEGKSQIERAAGLDAYRGPGVISGFADNPSHDPIIYRYDRIHPLSHAITNAGKKWIEYRTPQEIVGKVRDVYVCYRTAGKPVGTISVDQVPNGGLGADDEANDVIVAFEGGTGDKGEAGKPDSQSLMGYVLLRHWADRENYDIHIAFRGSRSGAAARAVGQSLSDHKASGNPDWITDLGYDLLDPGAGGGMISSRGNVSRGFATSMKSILPQVFGALGKIAELKPGKSPARIYVTGHSLGGALAQHFVSAVLLGDRFGPAGSGESMPSGVRDWPWKNLKMVTFGAPRAGDAEWARTLTTECLASEFFSSPADPVDRDALKVTDAEILPRLIDRSRPAGYRVLSSKDPITTERLPGGKHVGKTVYVNSPKLIDLVSPPSFKAHEPYLTRDAMVSSLRDSMIPGTSWRYLDMKKLNPSRKKGKSGSVEEFTKLRAAIDDYYNSQGHQFNHAAFGDDFELFLEILRAD